MTEDHKTRKTREWLREHAGQIGLLAAVLFGASAVGGVAFLKIMDGMEHYGPTEHDEYFEDQCNERFGVEWEYSRWVSQPETEEGEWEVVCALDTGFLSGSDETITVTPPTGESP